MGRTHFTNSSNSRCSSGEASGNNEDVTTTSNNSTQTPSDLSPPGPNEEVLPQAHHQNPGHCIASFAAINQMRNNAQVREKIRQENLIISKFKQIMFMARSISSSKISNAP